MKRFRSEGEIHYSIEPHAGHKLAVTVDPGIGETYRALIPKSIRLQRPKFPPHISVVRKEPVIPRPELWGRHEGRLIEFDYEPHVYNDETYYWLRAYSETLIEIRRELGLPYLSEMARAPDMFDSFHITLGNLKS